MDLKRIAGVAAIAAGVGISAVTFGVSPVTAAPFNPPAAPTSTPAPDEPQPDEPTRPTDGIVIPHSGGSDHGGHPATEEPQPLQ